MAEKGSVIDNQETDDFLSRSREEFFARTVEQALKLKYRERLASLSVTSRIVEGKQILVINWDPRENAPTMEEVSKYIEKLRRDWGQPYLAK